MQLQFCSATALDQMLLDTRKFLSAYCRDLVYVNTESRFCNERSDLCIRKTTVTFLHRTVYDFLKTDHVARLMLKYRPPSTDTSVLHRLTISRLSVLPSFPDSPGAMLGVVKCFVSEAEQVCCALDESNMRFQISEPIRFNMARALDELSEIHLAKSYFGHAPSSGIDDPDLGMSDHAERLLPTLTAYQMPRYLRESLQHPHSRLTRALSNFSRNGILGATLGYSFIRTVTRKDVDLETLRLVLRQTIQGTAKMLHERLLTYWLKPSFGALSGSCSWQTGSLFIATTQQDPISVADSPFSSVSAPVRSAPWTSSPIKKPLDSRPSSLSLDPTIRELGRCRSSCCAIERTETP